MNLSASRALKAVALFAADNAASEVEACRPHIEKALNELPADLRSGDPAAALLHTAKEAGAAMLAAGYANISLTGLLASAYHAWEAAGAVQAPPMVKVVDQSQTIPPG